MLDGLILYSSIPAFVCVAAYRSGKARFYTHFYQLHLGSAIHMLFHLFVLFKRFNNKNIRKYTKKIPLLPDFSG